MNDDADGDAPSSNATFFNLAAIGGTAVLHHNSDGNIYSFSEDNFDSTAKDLSNSKTFAGIAPWITSSHQGRLMHAYKDTLATLNISRLRLSHIESVPVTALPV